MRIENWVDVTCGPGAVGDGVTDDTVAIQTAIDSAGNGGVVVFPADKTFLISSTLKAPYSNHTWLMWGATLSMQSNGVAVQMGSFSVGPLSVTDVSVYGGSVIGQGANTSGWTSGNIGWQWVNVANFYHVDYYIYGFNIGQQLLGGGLDPGTFTVTIASPAVFTKTAHGFVNNQQVQFTTTGALPTGLSTGTNYYVIYVDANTFQVSATSGPGSPVSTSGTQSGTHTVTAPYGHGVQYGHLTPRHILGNKTGISCFADNGGWCNENAFYGAGRIGNSSGDPDASATAPFDYKISLSIGSNTTNVVNNNKFYGLALEDGRSLSNPMTPRRPSQAVYLNGEYCLLDYLRYEGNATPIIDNSGTSFGNGNAFRGGIGLTDPGTCLSNPTGGQYLFLGGTANVIQGDGPSSGHALVVRDVSTSGIVAFSVQNSSGMNDEFTVTGVGNTQVGFAATSLGAKLGILNPTPSQIGVAIAQVANATVPVVQIQDSSGTPVVTIKKNQNGTAAETDINILVGEPTTALAALADAGAGSIVAACGQLGTIVAIGTASGVDPGGGTLILGRDAGAAEVGGLTATIRLAANDGTGTLAAQPVIFFGAAGAWSTGSRPTSVGFCTTPIGSTMYAPFFGCDEGGNVSLEGAGDTNISPGGSVFIGPGGQTQFTGNTLGFFSATPASQQAPSGSCGNAVLYALCQALGSTTGVGLIDDSSITP